MKRGNRTEWAGPKVPLSGSRFPGMHIRCEAKRPRKKDDISSYAKGRGGGGPRKGKLKAGGPSSTREANRGVPSRTKEEKEQLDR